MVISVPVSDVFRYPSYDSEHIDEVMFGTDVEVADTMCGFVKITTEYGYSGWINEHDISVKLAEPNRIILFPWADLLKDDRNFYAPVMTLPLGSKVDAGYSEQFKRHAFVVLPDKRIFYIRKEALGNIPDGKSEEKARKIICETALSFLGVQYRWGGRTHKGIDCSGLAFTSYRMAGINIWRDADPDMTPGLVKITLGKAKPGDTLFFKGHMAIYLGDGSFVHASSSEARVTVASFDCNSINYSEWCDHNLICAGTVF
ncbi:MAG: SH3 domain-containing C40 family peptidase [Eubacteriales bacterium]|nr:SH3 domain-containing C40 family peptidase [Eubacteriales bacterium]